jgi:endogenous inhibitor of DNA gyrase (YacG/DUF329 family)
MPVELTRVNCFRCGKPVTRTNTVLVNPNGADRRYECSNCFYKHKGNPLDLLEEAPRVKRELYCHACRYKFKSYDRKCPYCGKYETVISSKVEMKDLL